MRKTQVTPKLARHIARHVITNVWQDNLDDWEQVQPGVFQPKDGDYGLVVMGAAFVSAPGVNTLRQCGRLWELLVLMRADGQHEVYGPRHLYEEADWANFIRTLFTHTQDVEAVLTTFEVMAIKTERDRADIGIVSAFVGEAFPTTEEADPEVLDELLEQVDKVVEEAA